jgi:hypothetical protein
MGLPGLARQTGCNGLIRHQKIKVNQGILKRFYFMQNQGSATVEVVMRSISGLTFPWGAVHIFSWTKWRVGSAKCRIQNPRRRGAGSRLTSGFALDSGAERPHWSRQVTAISRKACYAQRPQGAQRNTGKEDQFTSALCALCASTRAPLHLARHLLKYVQIPKNELLANKQLSPAQSLSKSVTALEKAEL